MYRELACIKLESFLFCSNNFDRRWVLTDLKQNNIHSVTKSTGGEKLENGKCNTTFHSARTSKKGKRGSGRFGFVATGVGSPGKVGNKAGLDLEQQISGEHFRLADKGCPKETRREIEHIEGPQLQNDCGGQKRTHEMGLLQKGNRMGDGVGGRFMFLLSMFQNLKICFIRKHDFS